MTKRPGITAALRELDPAPATPLTEQEQRHADAQLARILTSPEPDEGVAGARPSRPGRRRVLVPAALLATAVVGLSTFLGGGAAFADWTATPTPLAPQTAVAAAATCRAGMAMPPEISRVLVGERRGGWTYVLLDGTAGEGACLMPDDLVGADVAGDREARFFGSYDAEHVDPPEPAPDGLVETESMTGTVPLPGRLPLTTVDGLFVWVTGYAGSDVTRVVVDPPVGPDVVASLQDGRFAAWWPAGKARGAGTDGAWAYTVTLTDGTTRRV